MKTKKIIITILKVLILFILFGWVVLVFTDYFRVTSGKDPLFCISEKTTNYPDGANYTCTGLGYKMIRYNRACMSATEFGPFLIKERQCENNK